jgi:hypothetical protein
MVSDGIDVGDELVSIREYSGRFQLQVLLRPSDPNSIILYKLLKQMDSLVEEFVPGIAFRIFKGRLAVGVPLLEQDGRTVLPGEVGSYGRFEAPAEGHSGSRILLAPNRSSAFSSTSSRPRRSVS